MAKACDAQAHWFKLNTPTETFEVGNSPNPLASKLQFSREEAAQMLSISERTLDRLIAEKELPVRRIGRRVLIPKDALLSFMRRDHKTTVVN